MPNKNRILYLLQYLQDETDEDRSATTAQIRAVLREKGCPVTVETLRDDIAALREAGYDIAVNEKNGLSTTYSYIDRTMDDPELQILIDAVASAQFISKTRSRQLIAKLAAMAGPSHRSQLQPNILVSDAIKTPNSQLLYTVQKIRHAVDSDRKISFQYFRFDLDGQRVPRHDGKWYVISPYATIWKRDRYFMIGWSDEREKVVVFRVDRMGVPKMTRQRRVAAPAGFDVRHYTERIFNMYDEGDVETVTLRCLRPMMDHIVDYFGRDVSPYNVTETGFDVDVCVSVSPTFFSWVTNYVGEMTIAGPERVREAYQIGRAHV